MKSTQTTRNAKRHESPSEHENSLHELFIDEIRDLLSAETQLTKALPKLAKAAESSALKEAFESHLEETEGHVQRLEKILKEFEGKVSPKKCEGMAGLIKEGDEIMKEDHDEPHINDAGLISAAQKAEHYEIASYGTVRTFAEVLGYDEAVELLQQTLDEEKAADQKLTEICENLLNAEDSEAGESEEGESTENEGSAEVSDEEVE